MIYHSVCPKCGEWGASRDPFAELWCDDCNRPMKWNDEVPELEQWQIEQQEPERDWG